VRAADVLITEATLAYAALSSGRERWPGERSCSCWRPHRTASLLFAYAFGKAQRLRGTGGAGSAEEVLLHAALQEP